MAFIASPVELSKYDPEHPMPPSLAKRVGSRVSCHDSCKARPGQIDFVAVVYGSVSGKRGENLYIRIRDHVDHVVVHDVSCFGCLAQAVARAFVHSEVHSIARDGVCRQG